MLFISLAVLVAVLVASALLGIALLRLLDRMFPPES